VTYLPAGYSRSANPVDVQLSVVGKVQLMTRYLLDINTKRSHIYRRPDLEE
jgi:hypothetical protein